MGLCYKLTVPPPPNGYRLTVPPPPPNGYRLTVPPPPNGYRVTVPPHSTGKSKLLEEWMRSPAATQPTCLFSRTASTAASQMGTMEGKMKVERLNRCFTVSSSDSATSAGMECTHFMRTLWQNDRHLAWEHFHGVGI